MKYLLTLFALTASGAALADDAAAAQGPGMMGQLIFLGGFLLIFYFVLWRPQSKRQKDHKNLMEGLSAGDEVVTSGGILGKVIKVEDDFLTIELLGGVQMHVQKAAVTAVMPKGTIKKLKD